jgi:hypothetical protein
MEGFLILSKSAKGKAACELIKNVLDSNTVFVYGNLLSAPGYLGTVCFLLASSAFLICVPALCERPPSWRVRLLSCVCRCVFAYFQNSLFVCMCMGVIC